LAMRKKKQKQLLLLKTPQPGKDITTPRGGSGGPARGEARRFAGKKRQKYWFV